MIAAAVLALTFNAAGTDAASSPATPAASASAAVQEPAKAKPDPFPIHGSAGVTTSMGSATYVISPSNPTLQSLLVVGGSAKLTSEVGINVSQRIGFEWTNTDGDTYNHQLELADTHFGVGYNPGVLSFKDLGVGVGFSGGYSLPISMSSRAQGSLGGLTASAKATWTASMLEGFGAYAGLSAGYTPQVGALAARYANAPGKPFLATNGQLTNTLGCAEGVNAGDPENFACASIARARVALGVGASYQINEQLSFAGDLSYGQSFTEQPASTDGTTQLRDGTRIDNADLVGAHAVPGLLVPSQSTSASLSLSWQPVPWFTLTGGTASGQPFLTSDNKGLRFPFWDFVTPANNFSSLFIDTSFSI